MCPLMQLTIDCCSHPFGSSGLCVRCSVAGKNGLLLQFLYAVNIDKRGGMEEGQSDSMGVQ